MESQDNALADIRRASTEDGFWVFGYGSLMWRPGFAYEQAARARLRGWHRAMCVLSTHYRGTVEQPGLVLGLDRGGSCVGRVFRVSAGEALAVHRYLYDREMITNVYRPMVLPVTIEEGEQAGRRVPAYAFVVRHGHPQYQGKLGLAEAAAIIRRGCGEAGPCRDYLGSTVQHLVDCGIGDSALHRLWKLVEEG